MSIINTSKPVLSASDVLAVLPAYMKPNDPPPVRDAIVAALVEIYLAYQDSADYASAQSDVLRATGIYLDGLGDDRDMPRTKGEDQEVYRTRLLAVPDLVTPAAILAAVGNLLSPFTSKQAQYYEPLLDGLFIGDGDGAWHSFIGASPFYPDRLYPQDQFFNFGYARPQSDPGGAIPGTGVHEFGSLKAAGREFVLRVPSIESVQTLHAFIYSGGSTPSTFIGDGIDSFGGESSGNVATFMFGDTPTANQLYNTIIDVINRIKGHGIRWTLIVDERL